MDFKKRNWPKGIKCAACLTFDLDAESLWISRNEENLKRPITLSQGTFGVKVAVLKILELLQEHDIKTTFFIPAWVIERNESMVKDIFNQGHEISHHGYLHEWPDKLSPGEEEKILTRSMEIIEKTVGQKPFGYRSPAAEYTSSTLSLLKKHGFTYSSTMMDDILPYKHVIDRSKTNLVELPVHWSIDDAPYFLHSSRPPVSRMTITPRDFLEILEGAFMDYYEWGGCFNIMLHPQIIGRPGRFQILAEFIRFLEGFQQVWIARCVDIALYWQQNCE